MGSNLRIAVSGTYSTGKTTTAEALSILTGIPRVYARTARMLMPVYFPNKTLEQCSPFELMELELRKFNERIIHECKIDGGFITDGSSIHEYVYALARIKFGMNPSANLVERSIKKLIMLPFKPVFKGINECFGSIVKSHAKDTYDSFIHLPIEFPIVKDGHRPFNEKFRKICDECILSTIEELGINYYVVTGSIEERLEKIVNIYGFEPVTTIEAAVSEAKRRQQAEMIARERPQANYIRKNSADGLKA